MDNQLQVTGGAPAWALGSLTRQKVPNDVPTDDGDELSNKNPQADHLRKFIRSPKSMPEYPSLDAVLQDMQVSSSHLMGFHREESVLLEDWLNLMLRRPSPPVASRYSFSMSVDTDATGLTEYNLSREQLANYGLSQADVERGYRMLYVYSAGCYDVIKELCIRSLGKSFLIGCFWRAFIRLCEEQSKIGLQVEIADLVDQKRKAQNELRLTRGCLNGALDRLSLEFMKQMKLSETLAEETAMQDSRHQEVVGLQDRLQQSNFKVQELAKRVARAEHDRLQAVAQGVEATTMIRRAKSDKRAHQFLGAKMKFDALSVQAMDATRIMKRAKLDEHNASINEAKKIDEVDALKAKLAQLKEALALEKSHGTKLQQGYSRIEEELLKEERKAKENEANLNQLYQLKHQLGEKCSQLAILEQENEATRKDCSELKFQNATFEMKISCLNKEAANCAVSMAEAQHLVNERTRVCEEKMLESALLSDEVRSWVEGNEKLLAEQEKLVLEIVHVRNLLAHEGSEKREPTYSLHSLIACKDKAIHALTLGVVHLARMAQARPQFLKTPSAATGSCKERVGLVDKAVACTSSSILDDMISASGAEVFRLRDDLHKMEGSTKEEREKRSWLEKQTADAWKTLAKQKSELSDADQRVTNLALEKRTVEHLLNLAEDEIQRLRGKLTNLLHAHDEQSRKLDMLQTETAQTTAQTAAQQMISSAQILELKDSMAKEMEARKLAETIAADLKEQVKYLEWCLKDVTNSYDIAHAKKNKWKERANHNAQIIAQLRSQVSEMRSKLEPLLARNREVEYMIMDEKVLREEAERLLKEILAENDKLKLEIKGLESLLKGAENEKAAITRRATHLKVENEYLREERIRETIIREILQNEVDTLRLLTESLKIKLTASRRLADGEITGSQEATERLKERGTGKAKEIDDEVQKLESKIEALLATRVAEEEKLQADIRRRLSKQYEESRVKEEPGIAR